MRIGIISFFLLGSFVGYNAFVRWKFNGFLAPLASCGVLFLTMVYFALKNSRQAAKPH
jgi:hypothetical protein